MKVNDIERRERSDTMFKWFLGILVVLAVGLGLRYIIPQLPVLQRDIQRYIKMRTM